MELDQAVRAALGQEEGYLLPWWVFGCQVANGNIGRVRRLLTCPHHEAINQCEVVGPHTQHRWSDHTISHERFGNGYACWQIGDGLDADGRLLIPGGARLTVVGVR